MKKLILIAAATLVGLSSVAFAQGKMAPKKMAKMAHHKMMAKKMKGHKMMMAKKMKGHKMMMAKKMPPKKG